MSEKISLDSSDQPHKNETDGSIANAICCNALLQCLAINQATNSVFECFGFYGFPLSTWQMF